MNYMVGIIVSFCFWVLFVPSFWVMIQYIEETNRALKEFLSSSPFDYGYSWGNRKLDDEDYML